MQHLQPNTTLQGGKYKIERVLGQGGFSNTYVGYNTVFNEQVAIKEFFMKGVTLREEDQVTVSISVPDNCDSFMEQKEKFKKEALRIRQLKNEHIVAVHDLFEENGTAYYVMDYVDGENLAERLKRTGKPMTEQEVRQILPQILDALKTVHNAGIWHLDLKPANIMLDKDGNVKLIDFGASKQLNAQKGGATTSTAISYTNGYAPREQMEQNYDKFGPWTDIYALGATLYNLLTNKRPPLPTDIDDDLSDDKHNALPFPATTSTEMKKLVVQMMKTSRNKRPQSVGELSVFLCENEVDNETTIIATSKNRSNKETVVVNPPNENNDIEQDTKPQNNIGKNIIVVVVSILVLLVLYWGFNSRLRLSQDSDNTEDVVVDTTKPTMDSSSDYTDKVYDVAEVMPSYPGGQDALYTFLSNNINYPEEAATNGVQGRVQLTFIVEKDGSISNVEVVNSIDPSLDRESIRVVKLMKHWIPGKQNGEPVRVKYTLPITFRLE